MEKIKHAVEIVDENLHALEDEAETFAKEHPDAVDAIGEAADVTYDVALVALGSRLAGWRILKRIGNVVWYALDAVLPKFKI